MELLRALGALAESASPDTAAPAAALGLGPLDPADHTELFVLQLPPFASIYLGANGMLGGDARDRIAGFWRAAGQAPPAEPDHLTTLLSAYASLAEGEERGTDRPGWRRLRHAFFWEHLGSWLGPWSRRAREVAPPVYRPWAGLLEEAIAGEAVRLGPPSGLPAHLRDAAPAADEDEGPALLGAVLAPARSGVILTRHDLARAADGLGLGLRLGERRYILENFFHQAPEETAAWLAEEARRQAEAMMTSPTLPELTDHWVERARSTAARLDTRARSTPVRPDTYGVPVPPLQEATHG